MGAAGAPPSLAELPPLRRVVEAHGIAADKRLGQHFLFDTAILSRIARAAGGLEGHTVLEIGPGPGGLTRALLLAGAAQVIAVERDPRCLAALAGLEAAAGGRLRLVEGDALRFNPAGSAPPGELRLVANLPYNIGTELLVRWLQRPEPFHSITVLLQKEVVERLVARPGTGDYGRLAVLAQTICTVRSLFDLPGAAFVPPPKVASSLVQLVPRPDRPPTTLVSALERITGAAFGQRRKMLRQSLKGCTSEPSVLLELAGIAGERRAETLDLAEFRRLAELLISRAAPGTA